MTTKAPVAQGFETTTTPLEAFKGIDTTTNSFFGICISAICR